VIDPEFPADVQSVIDRRREPLNPPQWDQADVGIVLD
jgi:hypothetical protein